MNDPPAPRPATDAAGLLWRLWSEGETIDALPESLRPASLAEGWAIQRALDAHAGPAAGWKIAATSPAGQDSIGVDGPLVGRLYRSCLRPSGAEIDATALNMRIAEAEFAFRLRSDLVLGSAPVTREDVLAAIGELIPAIEVPDSRFRDVIGTPAPSLVADAMCAGFLVLGDAVVDWEPISLVNHDVSMHLGTDIVARGRGRDVLGDPIDALAWLAHELAARGVTLRAADIVTTGACTPPCPIGAGEVATADFGFLGNVNVRFGGR